MQQENWVTAMSGVVGTEADTKPNPQLEGSPGSSCSHLQTTLRWTGSCFNPVAWMKCTGNFSAPLSIFWASLTTKLHVYVYYYKIKEWVGCNVSFNHLYFYIRLLNMLLHTHKSVWVTKDIEHCLLKTVIKMETAQTACAHGCSAVSFRLLTSAYKPSFIFIRDLSAFILKCLPWNHTGIRKLLYLRK